MKAPQWDEHRGYQAGSLLLYNWLSSGGRGQWTGK